MHVLCVAGIYDRDGVALYGVGVVPFVSVRHVVAFPSAYGRTSSWQRTLDGIDGKESIAHVPFHGLIRIGMAILVSHIFVEGTDFGGGSFGV